MNKPGKTVLVKTFSLNNYKYRTFLRKIKFPPPNSSGMSRTSRKMKSIWDKRSLGKKKYFAQKIKTRPLPYKGKFFSQEIIRVPKTTKMMKKGWHKNVT